MVCRRLSHQFRNRPHLIGDSSFHHRGNAKTGMHAAEIVVSEVQGDGGFRVPPLLRKRIREPRESANLHSHRKVLPLEVRRANALALVLLLPFVATKLNKPLDRLTPTDLSVEVVRVFLTHLEESRQCSIATRNQRLAGLHTLARFVAERSPEHIVWCGQIRAIPFKKTTKVRGLAIGYGQKDIHLRLS